MTDRSYVPSVFKSLIELHALAYGLWRDEKAVEKYLITPTSRLGQKSPLLNMLQYGKPAIELEVEWFRSLTDDVQA